MQITMSGSVNKSVGGGAMMCEFGNHLDLTAHDATLRDNSKHLGRSIRGMWHHLRFGEYSMYSRRDTTRDTTIMVLVPNTKIRRWNLAQSDVKHPNLNRVSDVVSQHTDRSSLIGTGPLLGNIKAAISGNKDMVGAAVPVVDVGQSERIDNGIGQVLSNSDVVDGVKRLEVSWRRPRTGRTNGELGHVNAGNKTVVVKKITGKLSGTDDVGAGAWANLMTSIVVAKYDAWIPTREDETHNKLIKGNAFFRTSAGRGVQGNKPTTKSRRVTIDDQESRFKVDGKKVIDTKE